MDSGVLVVISGFSGAGKGTLVKRLLEKYENYVLSISATTRSPREGEQDGREYFFVTRERFEEMISGGELRTGGGTFGGALQCVGRALDAELE